MTPKKAYEFGVKSEDGFILITQDNFSRGEPETIMLHPDQIDQLVGWVQSERDRLKESNSKE